MKISTPLLVIAMASLLPHGAAHGQHMDPAKQAEHHALHNLLDTQLATHIADSNGPWSNPTTWNSGSIPGADARVHIPEGVTVTYDAAPAGAPDLDWVRVDGTLTWATNVSTEMRIDTLVATSTSTLKIGDSTQPIADAVTARILILDNGPIDTVWDWHQLSRGIVTHGTVRMHGAEKVTWTQLAQDASAGSDQIVLRDSVNLGGNPSWAPGDQLVITGTELVEDRPHLDPWVTQDEERTVSAISSDGKTITLNSSLTYAHTGRGNDILGRPMHGYVGNFTRNIIIETQNAASLPSNQRGHIMFMHNADVDVRYVQCQELGRTDKSFALDDFLQEEPGNRFSDRVLDAEGDPLPGARTNIRGRYAMHFHRTGAEDLNGTAAVAYGNAVWGSPGWGIVHHDSHADIINNVTYNIMGAHIVAETANEIGVWDDNLTIKTPHGEVGEGKAGHSNHDVGFTGDGFWFQGRLIRTRGNVAAGMRTAGFHYFTRGVDQIDPVAEALDFPFITRYEPDISPGNPQIQEFKDNVSLACFEGFTVVKHSPSQGHSARSRIDGLTAWEVKFPVLNSYTALYTFVDCTFLRYEPGNSGSHEAIKLGNTIYDMVFNNCRVEDFGRVLSWNGNDTHSALPDYHLTFIDMDLVNTPAIYDIATGKSAGVTDPADHVHILTSADLDQSGILDITLDGNSNFDFDTGAVLISGTLTDSVGDRPFPGERVGLARFTAFYVDKRIIETGYWTDPVDPSIAVFTVEEVIEDRADGARVILEFPVTWAVNNMPAEAAYNGVWTGGAQEILAKDFDDNDLSGWTAWSQSTGNPGAWSISGGELVQGNNSPNTILFWNDADALNWTNYDFAADARITDDDQWGMVFYYQDENNYYLLELSQNSSPANLTDDSARLILVQNGNETELASANYGLTQGVDYQIKIEIDSSGDIYAGIDDGTGATDLFGGAVNSTALTSGTVGFFCEWQRSAYFDNVLVNSFSGGTPIPEPTANLQIEAEDYDSGDYEIFTDNANASPAAAPAYLDKSGGNSSTNQSPTDSTSGQSQYSLTLEAEADLTIWAKVSLPDGGANSFYYRLDEIDGTGNWNQFSSGTTSTWEWRELGTYSDLPADDYNFRLQWRETGAGIDQLYFSTDGSVPQ